MTFWDSALTPKKEKLALEALFYYWFSEDAEEGCLAASTPLPEAGYEWLLWQMLAPQGQEALLISFK